MGFILFGVVHALKGRTFHTQTSCQHLDCRAGSPAFTSAGAECRELSASAWEPQVSQGCSGCGAAGLLSLLAWLLWSGLSDTWWNSSNCSVCSWYWEHELLEKVEPCQCVHSSNLPCLGWLLQVEMFLSPVPGLTSCYCLQGSCLCFFLRDQTLVSSLISLPWAPNGLEGFLALLSTLSEMGNFLFWLDYIFVSSI